MNVKNKLIVILEDNREQALKIKKFVRETNGKADIFVTDSIEWAYKVISRKNVALLIADLDLGKDACTERPVIRLILQLRKHSTSAFLPIIVLDSSDEYRLSAFQDWHCVGHYKKPVLEEHFKELVRKMLCAIMPNEQENFFVIRRHNVRYVVKVKELMYVKYFDRALHFYMSTGDVFVVEQKPLRMVIDVSGTKSIMQCSRGVLINLMHVKKINFGTKDLLLRNGETMKIGDTFAKHIRETWVGLDEMIKKSEEEMEL